MREHLTRSTVPIAAAVLFGCAAAAGPAQQPPAPPPPQTAPPAPAAAAAPRPGPVVGSIAPDFELPTVTRYGRIAQPFRLSQFRGQTVVLAFFSQARTRG